MKKVDAGATKGLVKPKKTPKAREAEGRPENSLLRLQQGLGNRAMGELLGGLQRQPEEEEEPLQGKTDLQAQEEVQTKSPEGEEEEEAGEEEEFEEEALQGKADLQRQEPEEEEEPPQGKPDLQAQEEVQTKSPEGEEEEEAGEEEEFEEEALQGKADLQRQGPEEEEEPLQGKTDLQAQEEGEEPEEEEEEPVQTKTDAPAVSPQLMGAIESRRGGGHELEARVRRRAEQAFGYDFRDVRVHTDSEADGLARGLQAKAFTTGKDIFFRGKDFDPHSAAGQKLIGHELTHVVQQAQGLSEPAGRPGDRYEQEADQVAAAAFGRETSQAPGVQGKAEGLQAELQRQSEPEEEEEELQPRVQAQEETEEEI